MDAYRTSPEKEAALAPINDRVSNLLLWKGTPPLLLVGTATTVALICYIAYKNAVLLVCVGLCLLMAFGVFVATKCLYRTALDIRGSLLLRHLKKKSKEDWARMPEDERKRLLAISSGERTAWKSEIFNLVYEAQLQEVIQGK